MCYYNGQRVARAEYIRLRQLEKAVAAHDFLNRDLLVGFDYGNSAVLKRREGVTDFDLVQMEWGFIPPYLKTREDVFRMRHGYQDAGGRFHPPITTLNAVSEEILRPGKIYREAALHRRCLVLSSGFYEWRHVHRLNRRTGKPLKTAEKYPYFVTLKGRAYFFLAGIWQPWTDQATGEYVESFSVLTTAANALMEQVHNSKKRMPTILEEDQAWEWLFGEPDENRIRELGMTQMPPEKMQAVSIAKDFRESPDPTRPFPYPELPELVV
ncbi:MAG TPA: SOS response-associated peptidase family protein [Chitinophagaceae bacterium]|nr:SOS response-associated peptidase family protein [Chitinophagaceae bacterium]